MPKQAIWLLVFLYMFSAAGSIYAELESGSRVELLPFNVIEESDFDGDSTDISKLRGRDFDRVSDLILEKKGNGKIVYLDDVNLTGAAVGNRIKLDKYITISHNRIEVGGEKHSVFNMTARLTLENLTFASPRILMDGEPCHAGICTNISYSNGTLEFTVAHFTVYSAEETPDEADEAEDSADSSVPSRSGGGGAAKARTKSFTVEPSFIKATLRHWETKTAYINISNTGNTLLEFIVNIGELKNFILPEEYAFELKTGERKSLRLGISASESALPDIYPGQIKITAQGITQTINTLIDIISRNALFDVGMSLDSGIVMQGSDIYANITVINTGDLFPVDVSIEYIIKDMEGNVAGYNAETLAVGTVLPIFKVFRIPEDTPAGDYVAYVRLKYRDTVAAASSLFTVMEMEGVALPAKQSVCGDSVCSSEEDSNLCPSDCGNGRRNIIIVFAAVLLFAFLLLLLMRKKPKSEQIVIKLKR